MAGRGIFTATAHQDDLASPRRAALKRPLLACGVLSSVLYIAMNAFVPVLYEGYSAISQTVSELSAIGAPTRPLWVWLGTIYAVLVVAFGSGVWISADRNRSLQVAAALLVVDGLFSLYWPPMHMRGAAFTLTDALHIVWSIVTVLMMMLAIGFAASTLGRRFGIYSIATMLILVLFGALTAMDGPRIASNLPTPWVGVWERISIAAFMFWVILFAVTLLRRGTLAPGSSVPRLAGATGLQ
jgi:hypothetical protein